MSEAVNALGGAVFEGAALVEEAAPRGMITLRGDLASKQIAEAVRTATGAEMPDPSTAQLSGETGVCWMSPDEVLLLVPYAEVATKAAEIGASLAGTHHLVANVSDARALFIVSGPAARETIAKLTPADLHPDAFGPGQFRRTRLAQVPAAIWMSDEVTFELICFRSNADYLFEILRSGAATGAEVGYF